MNIAAAALVCLLAALAPAMARTHELGPDKVIQLYKTGNLQALEQLNQAALARHPGATITETDMEEKYGRYLYQIELRDTRGAEWDLEFDAITGELLHSRQDS